MEKIQWLKLNDRKDIYTRMVDKIAAKDFVSQRIGSEFIIPTLAVWDNINLIDIKSLPDKFVLKTTHGGGNNGVCICKSKSDFDLDKAKKRLQSSLKHDIYKEYREWPYKNVPRKIIAEQYLDFPDGDDLIDYKIYCFNGVPRFIQVIKDRNSNETIDFFDTSWNRQPFYGLNPKPKPSLAEIPRPQNLEKMIEIAQILSEGITFLRVDLYNIEGRIYFGEMTFYPASGMGAFTPSDWDVKLGQMLKLPFEQ